MDFFVLVLLFAFFFTCGLFATADETKEEKKRKTPNTDKHVESNEVQNIDSEPSSEPESAFSEAPRILLMVVFWTIGAVAGCYVFNIKLF